MPRHVAFLRGFNLGKRRVTMARLINVFANLGHSRVESFIASGNLVFISNSTSRATLETAASVALQKALGFDVDVIIRTENEVLAICQSNAFSPITAANPGSVQVGLMKTAPPKEEARKLEALQTPTDEFLVIGRDFYWRCLTGLSESKVWTLPEAKALRLPVSTIRNMTTIQKLAAKFFSKTS